MMTLVITILALLQGIIPQGPAYMKQLQQRDSVLIADQIEYGFELDNVAEGTQISLQDFSKISNDTLYVVKNWQLDTLKASGGKRGAARIFNIRGKVILAAFEEGKYLLPPVPVQLKYTSGKIDTLLFEAQELDVKTMPVDTASFEIHDIKGQIRYPVTFKEVLPYILGALLLAALVALAIYLVRKYRSKESDEESDEPAYIIALRKLENFRGDKYWAPEKQKSYYSGITDTLRAYMADRFSIDAKEMTTAEIFAALKKNPDLTPDLYEQTKELFETADFVKFAKFIVSDEYNAKALPAAVRFVTATYQVEVEKEGGENVLSES